ARVEIAEHEIRIGDSGLEAAQAIAGWSGIRARAVRAHAQEPSLDARTAPPSRTDLDEIHAGDLDGQTAALAHADHVDLELIRARGHATLDEGRLGGGAPPVEGDQILVAGEPADVGGEDGTGGRARVERAHGERGSSLRSSDATVVLHHVEPAGESALLEAGAEGMKVLRKPRGDVGVDHRGV